MERVKETPGSTTRLIIEYVRRHAGDAGVEALLARTDLSAPLEVLLDESQWLTYGDKIALFESAAHLLGDPEIGRHVGESVLRGPVGQLVPILRALGTPGQALACVVDASDSFCPVADMTLVEAGDHHAVIDYRLHPPYAPSIHDCQYTQGMLSCIGPVFDLPPATVEHPVCAVDGDDACTYRVSWAPVPRVRRRNRRGRRTQVKGLTARFWELESSTPGLITDGDPAEVLDGIAARAADAVGGVGHVLILTTADGSPRVTQQGLVGGTAALVNAVFEGLIDDDDPRRMVVPLRSERTRYGHLVVLFGDDHEPAPEIRTILAAHARHVAVTLDAASAIRAAQVREETASVLLDLARSLSEVTSVDDVATRIAHALPAITGADQAAVMLLDRGTRSLHVRAAVGVPDDLKAEVDELVIPIDEAALEMPRESAETPILIRRAAATGMMADLMDRHRETAVALVPMRMRGRLRGMMTCGWFGEVTGDADALQERLRAIADQAATALENATLLEQVRHQALHDALTGLPNQTLFADRVETEVTRAKRNRGRVVVGVLDLDRFKTVNDSLGHGAGDQLLVQVSERLVHAMRAPDTIARMGGDEFTLLLPEVAEGGESIVAERILEAFVQPFEVEGHRLRISPSIGLAVYPDDGDSFDQLLRCADVAMYRAKDRGRNTWSCYASGMAERAYDRLTLETDLYRALQRRELRVVYQPIARVSDNHPVATEALVRWAHPSLGMLMPDDFLPIAEDLGLMAEIDGWVLRQACLELGAATAAGSELVRVTVNLSARTLCHPALERLVADALAAGGLDPHRLVVEINEEITADRVHALGEGLRTLRTLGVRIALDDFGRGHSALSRLEQLPIDQLKVDPTFFAGVDADTPAPVVEAIVAMGHGLGLEVIAEGVETQAQLEFATRLGFDLVQGWFVARPATAFDYEGASSRTA